MINKAFFCLPSKGVVPIEYFDFWTVVTGSAYTYSMTIGGTFGETLYIDWGDGVKEDYILGSGTQVVTHDYNAGTFTQKWNVLKTAITTLAANTQRLSGELPLELQGFTSLVNFQIYSNTFNTDVSTDGWLTAFSSWTNLEFFYIYSNQLTGAITSWNVSTLSSMRFFQIQLNSFTGNIGEWDLSGWVDAVYILIYGMSSIQGDLTNWDLSALTLLNRLYLYGLDLSGSIANIGNENWSSISRTFLFDNSLTGLNDYAITYFNNRTTYSTASKLIAIQSNSEYLTGTYQQPDLGTYTGDVNDLTEGEIDNLAAGTDYTGTGTNVIWSTQEKVWVLENLDTTSTSGVLRYGFAFTYDSGIAEYKAINAGALGLPAATDFIDTNTDGIADWWQGSGFTAAYSIVTGNGFVGNAQRAQFNTTPRISSYLDTNSFTVDESGDVVTYVLAIRYRLDTPSPVVINVKEFGNTYLTDNLPINTGDAKVFISTPFDMLPDTAIVSVTIPDTGRTIDFIEIDEVALIQI